MTHETTQFGHLVEPLIELANKAGSEILKIYQSDFEVIAKSDQSPLTEADMASHMVIVTELRGLTPEWPVLSEESAEVPYSERRHWSRYWLIDPLDGTKEFVKRNGEFTVNIALIDQHRPVLGVVHVPVRKQTYFGICGQGAFRIDADGHKHAIKPTLPPATPLRVVGSRSHLGQRVAAYLSTMVDCSMVSMGSSLKLCLVAEGAADLYPRLGPTSEWDTAAAQAVVEAAGGHVVRTDGSKLRYNTRESLLNPEFLVFADASRDWTAAVPAGPTHEDSLG